MIQMTEQERAALLHMMEVDPWECHLGPNGTCPEKEMQKIVDENPTPLLRAVMSVEQDGRACPGPDIHAQVEVALGILHPTRPGFDEETERYLNRWVKSIK